MVKLPIYPGQDGVFTLYQDEGDYYNYAKELICDHPDAVGKTKTAVSFSKNDRRISWNEQIPGIFYFGGW